MLVSLYAASPLPPFTRLFLSTCCTTADGPLVAGGSLWTTASGPGLSSWISIISVGFLPPKYSTQSTGRLFFLLLTSLLLARARSSGWSGGICDVAATGARDVWAA